MSENSQSERENIAIHLETNEISVAPGSSVVLPIKLTNATSQAGSFRFFIEGIPPSWASMTTPVTYLEAGEEKQVTLVIQPPKQTETGPGNFPLLIRVANEQDASQTDKAEITLTVAAYTVEGRIGVMMESTQFSVSPGGNTSIQMLLHNQGLVDDEFQLSVDGIPMSWISTPSPVIRLASGEQKRVVMTISPPPGAAARAGRDNQQRGSGSGGKNRLCTDNFRCNRI